MEQDVIKKKEDLIQELATNARISEYGCTCAVLAGDWERAMLEAERADVFRSSLIKTIENFVNSIEKEKEEE